MDKCGLFLCTGWGIDDVVDAFDVVIIVIEVVFFVLGVWWWRFFAGGA